jgi:succinoglycan biosynthesis protein ExoU
VAELLEAIMPAYNASGSIRDSIDSAWCLNRIPVLVVDDGSTDDTFEQVTPVPGARAIRQSNAGPSVARNRGLLESDAEFVLFLDSDDLLLPGYRDQFEHALAADPGADVFVCGMQVRDDDDQLIAVHVTPDLKPTPFLSVLRGTPVPTNGIIVRRSVLARGGLFRPGLNHAEDLDLWLRIGAVTDRWVAMPEPLALYRVRDGSLSKDAPAMWRGIHVVLADACRLPVAPWLSRRRARRRAVSNAARYVLGGYIARWRGAAHTSRRDLCRELGRLPARLWPLMIRHAARVVCSRLASAVAR